jgi:hypothetical protein
MEGNYAAAYAAGVKFEYVILRKCWLYRKGNIVKKP